MYVYVLCVLCVVLTLRGVPLALLVAGEYGDLMLS